jgi:hypothetical protein
VRIASCADLPRYLACARCATKLCAVDLAIASSMAKVASSLARCETSVSVAPGLV